MSAVSDIKSQLDLAQVAQLLGTDEATAGQAVDQALESLVGTMDANVGDPDQALGLTRALGDHVDAASEVDLAQVDTADGEKIVGHVFSNDQIQALSQGAGGSLIRKLLPSAGKKNCNSLKGPWPSCCMVGTIGGSGSVETSNSNASWFASRKEICVTVPANNPMIGKRCVRVRGDK